MMIKVVPNCGTGAMCQGTQLQTESGEVIQGVRRLVLIAEPNSAWRATVDLDVELAGPIVAELVEAKA